MKAVTLWQPWATLIAIGAKTIETRSWPAPKSLIGQRVAIHAAKRPSDTEADFRFDDIFHEHGTCFVDLPLGAVVATARIDECVPMYHIAQLIGGTAGVVWPNIQLNGTKAATYTNGDDHVVRVDDQIPFGDFAPGRWAWMLGAIEPFANPIPATGRQGIWEWTP